MNKSERYEFLGCLACSVLLALPPVANSFGATSWPAHWIGLSSAANAALLLLVLARNDDPPAGSRYLSWIYVMALAILVMSEWHGAMTAAQAAATAIAWGSPSTIIAFAWGRGAGHGALNVTNAAALFGDLGSILDRMGPAVAIAALALSAATIMLSGDGLLVAAILLAALGSPGAVLAWPSLWRTARGELKCRGVTAASPTALEAIADVQAIAINDARCLVSAEPKVVAIIPADGVKPDRLLTIAISLVQDRDDHTAKALLAFGVDHRIRIKAATGIDVSPDGVIRGSLPDPTGIAALGPLPAMSAAGFDHGGLELALAHHLELGRLALLVVTLEPFRQVLGAVILCHSLRKGAQESLRALLQANYSVDLTASPDELPGATYSLRQLNLRTSSLLGDATKSEGVFHLLLSLDRSECGQQPLLTLSVNDGGIRSPADAQCRMTYDDPRSIPEIIAFAVAYVGRRRLSQGMIALAPLITVALVASGLLSTDMSISLTALAGIAMALGAAQTLRFTPRFASSRN